MGTMDFLKDLQGKVIDAATYQLLERNFQMQTDNNQLLQDKCALLTEKNSTLQQQVTDIRAELSDLRQRISAHEADTMFKELDGVLFKQKTDGKYSQIPYCPRCKSMMGNARGRLFNCEKCKYVKDMRLPLGRCMEILNSP
ncbi:MAG: hypothetical protein WAX69_10570 [Victivallales bacterium]